MSCCRRLFTADTRAVALPLCGRAGGENDIFKTVVAYFPTLVISLSSGVWLCVNSVFAVILTQYLDRRPVKLAHGYFMWPNSHRRIWLSCDKQSSLTSRLPLRLSATGCKWWQVFLLKPVTANWPWNSFCSRSSFSIKQQSADGREALFFFFPLPATPEQMYRAPWRACQWGSLFFNYSISAQVEGGRGLDLWMKYWFLNTWLGFIKFIP